MHKPDEIAAWPGRLEQCSTWNILILRETASTQDAARGHATGTAVIAGRQTAGRGRLGRKWADTGDEGVAVTFVTPADRPERLAIGAAVAVATALEGLIGVGADSTDRIGIKWPNDIVANGRKLAGVLVEQSGAKAYVGVGVNVGQRGFDDAGLAERAISLRQLGSAAHRVEVLERLLPAMEQWLCADDSAMCEAFEQRNALRGATIRVRCTGIEHEGLLVGIDPFKGLKLQTNAGAVYLPAATSTVVGVESWGDSG